MSGLVTMIELDSPAQKSRKLSEYRVRNPRQFDVIVTDNLFGDMLSDEAAMSRAQYRPFAVGGKRRPR
jgi:isocitrate/isopropylmalate dehydrogenase